MKNIILSSVFEKWENLVFQEKKQPMPKIGNNENNLIIFLAEYQDKYWNKIMQK